MVTQTTTNTDHSGLPDCEQGMDFQNIFVAPENLASDLTFSVKKVQGLRIQDLPSASVMFKSGPAGEVSITAEGVVETRQHIFAVQDSHGHLRIWGQYKIKSAHKPLLIKIAIPPDTIKAMFDGSFSVLSNVAFNSLSVESSLTFR